MELQEIYLLAEIVAAFSVVASLLFVGIQMQQNTRAMRIAAGQGMVAAWGASNRDIVNDPSMAEILAPLMAGSSDLPTGADGLRLMMWSQNIIREGEMNYYNWVNGNLDTHHWEQVKSNAVWLLSTPAGRAMWKQLRLTYGTEFQAVLDGLATELSQQDSGHPFSVEQ